MQKGQFSFEIRQAMQVGFAVAEEIANNPHYRGSPTATNGMRPVLLSFSGTTFRFEGGTVVKVHMVDIDNGRNHVEEWVVTHVNVRYRPYPPYADSPMGEKVCETWGADKLRVLKKHRPWSHPHVLDLEEKDMWEEFREWCNSD